MTISIALWMRPGKPWLEIISDNIAISESSETSESHNVEHSPNYTPRVERNTLDKSLGRDSTESGSGGCANMILNTMKCNICVRIHWARAPHIICYKIFLFTYSDEEREKKIQKRKLLWQFLTIVPGQNGTSPAHTNTHTKAILWGRKLSAFFPKMLFPIKNSESLLVPNVWRRVKDEKKSWKEEKSVNLTWFWYLNYTFALLRLFKPRPPGSQ